MKLNPPLTDRARAAYARATSIASAFNHDYVGVEHLLAGIISDPVSPATIVLNQFGISGAAVRTELEKCMAFGPGPIKEQFGAPPANTGLPRTSRLIKAFELAAREAQYDDYNFTGTGHLLLALLQQGSMASDVLKLLGADYYKIRNALLQLVARGPSPDTGDSVKDIDTADDKFTGECELNRQKDEKEGNKLRDYTERKLNELLQDANAYLEAVRKYDYETEVLIDLSMRASCARKALQP